MAASPEAMHTSKSVPGPVYVYEAPVRIWHWVHALSISTLAVTGYFIANPLPSLSGEASDHFLMGNIRFVHFTAAYVFAVGLFVRLYWAIVGNEYARELFILPVWRGEWWKRVWHEIKFYAFFRIIDFQDSQESRSQRSRTYSSSARPSLTITWARALMIGTLVPGNSGR